MKLSSIIGQPRALSLLRSAMERGRVHHAWLFAGPPGVGKEATARAFAASLLCSTEEPDACGVCLSCQKLERGVHPDLLVVLPEAQAVARKMIAREDLPRAPSRELKIEQIRQLQASLALAPIEGARRVVLLIGAETLNVPAQNAFLKTLEEPPAGTHLILLSDAADSLLPTTRSRCVRVPFAALPAELIAGQLVEAGSTPEDARLRAALSMGSLSVALSLDGRAIEERSGLLEAVEALERGRLGPALELADEIGAQGREGAERALETLSLFYRDALLAAEGVEGQALANIDCLPLVQQAASRGAEDALRRHRLVEEAKQAVGRHAMVRLAFERLLLSFLLPEVER